MRKISSFLSTFILSFFLVILLINCADDDMAGGPEVDGGTPAVFVKSYTVQEKKVFPSLKVIGTIVQKEKADITPLVSGRVNRVIKDTGDFVKQGDVLAILDQKFAGIKLEQAKNSLSAASNALEKAQLNYIEQSRNIESKFLELEKLKAELENRRNNLKEIEEEIAKKTELYNVGGIPREEITKLEYNRLSTKKDLFVTQQNLRIAEIGFRDKDIRDAGYNVPDLPEKRINVLKEIHTRMLKLQIKDARSALTKAKLDLQSAQIGFDETVIKSPISGIIGQRVIHIGERVDEKSHLFTIMDTHNVYWIVTVTELEAGKIIKGNKCSFTIDALGTKKFTGKVAIISPVVDPKSRTVEVRVLLDNKDYVLQPGMFGRGVVYGDTQKSQIRIPVTSFVSYDGQYASIYVVKKNRAFLKKIQVGLEENDMVEVLDGLSDKDIIVDEPPVNLVSGMVVTVK